MTLPEGRQPMQSDDMAKLHPSTWQAECEQLRHKLSEAESRASWAEMTKNRATDEAKALRIENSLLIEERDRALAWRDKDWRASQDNTALRARVNALRAENESLTDCYEEAVNLYSEFADKYLSFSNRVVNQTNRIAELEAALREIAAQKHTDELSRDEWDVADFTGVYDECINTARAALQQESGE